MHVYARSFALVIMRYMHRSWLDTNLITELPAQIFEKNVNLVYMCVCLHCLTATSAVVRRCRCCASRARGLAWRPVPAWPCVRRCERLPSSVQCLPGACMGSPPQCCT